MADMHVSLISLTRRCSDQAVDGHTRARVNVFIPLALHATALSIAGDSVLLHIINEGHTPIWEREFQSEVVDESSWQTDLGARISITGRGWCG